MDEPKFWKMIESAWKKAVGGKTKAREKMAKGTHSEEQAEEVLESVDGVIEELRGSLEELSAADLLAFDRILERKLYDIDREEIHEHTDGSDDGFLYARGFIVAAGQAYYDAVSAHPERAIMDFECEEMCYLSFHVHREKFGPVPPSGISRETQGNRAGWSETEVE